MRIAACDDNLEFLQGLSELLNKYGEENHCNVEYKVFTNPLELVTQMEKGIHYDMILLDICMPGMNGIQCAKDIRMYDNFVKIVFLTTSAEYAVESYSVKAHDYLLKPIQKERLFSLLHQVEKEERLEKNIIVVKTKAGITKIALAKLEYGEVVNRKLILHLANKEELECGVRINELEEKLQDGMQRKLRLNRHKLEIYIERLKGLSPLDKLNQGFSYVSDENGKAARSLPPAVKWWRRGCGRSGRADCADGQNTDTPSCPH